MPIDCRSVTPKLLSTSLLRCREESWQRQLMGKEVMNGALMRGQISARMGVIITYLALLHLAVMMCSRDITVPQTAVCTPCPGT